MVVPQQDEHGLGRLYIPDERDYDYNLRSEIVAAPVEELPRWKYWWPSGWWGDQEQTPQCVAYAWLHYIADGPHTHVGEGKELPAVDPRGLYCEAQKHDPWEGDCVNNLYDGTSVRAGAKVLQDMGLITRYVWAWDIETVIRALLLDGPVVLGTTWYSDMFSPNEEGLIEPTGRPVGGHAYIANGINRDRGVIRLKNSWGRSWGDDGYAWIKVHDLALLLADYGEACSPRRD